LDYSEAEQKKNNFIECVNLENRIMKQMSDIQRKNYLIRKKLFFALTPEIDRQKASEEYIMQYSQKIKEARHKSLEKIKIHPSHSEIINYRKSNGQKVINNKRSNLLPEIYEHKRNLSHAV
jgi:hypothetical protein